MPEQLIVDPEAKLDQDAIDTRFQEWALFFIEIYDSPIPVEDVFKLDPVHLTEQQRLVRGGGEIRTLIAGLVAQPEQYDSVWGKFAERTRNVPGNNIPLGTTHTVVSTYLVPTEGDKRTLNYPLGKLYVQATEMSALTDLTPNQPRYFVDVVEAHISKALSDVEATSTLGAEEGAKAKVHAEKRLDRLMNTRLEEFVIGHNLVTDQHSRDLRTAGYRIIVYPRRVVVTALAYPGGEPWDFDPPVMTLDRSP